MEVLGLHRLLAPRSAEEFFDGFFQKRPCVIQGRDPSVYTGLLSLTQIEQVIDNFDPRDGICRLLGGNDPGAHRPVEKKGELRDVLVAYGRGATINVSGLDRGCPAVGELRRQLIADFAARGIVLTEHGESVVFITPANSQALKPHVDPDDLFVLQLEGRKRWNVYAWDPFWRAHRAEPPPPALEVELKPGDLLYVPQHWIHAASAGEEFSFALTVGFRPASWATVLTSLSTRHLFGLAPLFEALPAWALSGHQLTPRGKDRLTEVLKQVLDAPVFREAMERFELEPAVSSSVASGGIAAMNRMGTIDRQTRCALAGPARVEHWLDGVAIATEERRVKGPHAIEPALRWIADQTEEFPVGAMAGPLSDNAKVVLARRLILEGVLHVRAEAGGAL